MDLTDKQTAWVGLVRRIMQEARSTLENNKSDGLAIVTAHILLDASGEPMLWVVGEGRRIEPSKDAKTILQQLTHLL